LEFYSFHPEIGRSGSSPKKLAGIHFFLDTPRAKKTGNVTGPSQKQHVTDTLPKFFHNRLGKVNPRQPLPLIIFRFNNPQKNI